MQISQNKICNSYTHVFNSKEAIEWMNFIFEKMKYNEKQKKSIIDAFINFISKENKLDWNSAYMLYLFFNNKNVIENLKLFLNEKKENWIELSSFLKYVIFTNNWAENIKNYVIDRIDSLGIYY